MARFTDDSRERVRDAVDFVDLVGAKTELRRAGARRWQGLCPFHEERTPSFGIDPSSKVYYCFGCGQGGDVFKFVMETEGLDFGGALEALADRYGVELEREAEDPAEAAKRHRRERLWALLDRAASWYARVLAERDEAAHARDYLAGRGLGDEVLRTFRVGWAPDAWDRMAGVVRAAGYSEDELLAAGLAARRRDGGLYDRFRARVTFPLCDARGRVLGFGARTLGDEQPKYLNSSEGAVFQKGRLVYGADLARADAARLGSVVLVEGYTDVLALHQAGIRNVVGLMGTALTADQVRELGRLAPTLVFCLDADAAGREAMVRAAQLVRAAGRGPARPLELRVAPLPAGSDPADVVAAEGAEAIAERLGAAAPFARFLVERALEDGDLSSPEGRDRVVGELAPVFATVQRGMLFEELLRRAADRLGTSADLLVRLLPPEGEPAARAAGEAPPGAGPSVGGGQWAGRGERPWAGRGRDRSGRRGRDGGAWERRGAGPAPPPPRPEDVWDRHEATERAFLARCLAVPAAGRRELERLDVEELFASDLTRRAARHLAGHLDRPGDDLPAGDDAFAGLIASLIIRAGELDDDPAALRLERLQLQMVGLDRDIATARRRGEPVGQIAARRQRIHEEIRHLLV